MYVVHRHNLLVTYEVSSRTYLKLVFLFCRDNKSAGAASASTFEYCYSYTAVTC